MRLIASVCVLGLFMFVLGQEDKNEAREVKAAEDDSVWFKGEEKYLKYWTHSWPKCKKTNEPAWRPCHKCCPLGYICTTDIAWDFPGNTDIWLPPVFMWKWWCCENEPCPNIHWLLDLMCTQLFPLSSGSYSSKRETFYVKWQPGSSDDEKTSKNPKSAY